ncbi:MAG: hypothetical protein JWR75_1953 [Devosia sp.]|nr:hypothetical protein [Devosia sp.]
MATLALSLAGQFAGGVVGGPFGATFGRALGALAGSAVDGWLFGEQKPVAAPADLRLTGSREGAPIARIYGWNRVAGNIIWATELEAVEPEDTGAKGGLFAADPGASPLAANFAVGLCAGEVQRLGRIWADGQLLETEGLTLRFHRGTEDQPADSLIAGKQGADAAPAYRGLCYLVFERLPLAPFGNRIPNITVELCRAIGDLEPAIRAVTVIPGATEFGYDPVPRLRLVSPGVTRAENAHLSSELSDWTLSLDELQALCPNLERVSLVVAWFGDDLRCGHCTIRPKVEAAERAVEGTAWAVAGLSRGAAGVVSTHAGGPAYGGTPSDAAVLAAIADLKARGLAVTLYPIVLMDIPAGNVLPDPVSGGTGQAAYPWRGRITSASAGTGTVTAEVEDFLGGEWGYRRMVLHYAALAEAAGGVDALLIGSELRGLTALRDAGDGFPFVAGLVALAVDVRAVVGAGTQLSYAADWSEYSGVQGAGGERLFNLDPLWASAVIDAIGIDNYMPVADWRDGEAHLDAAVAGSVYDLDYLRAGIAGGEGFDWYYASDADRLAQLRTSITDGAYGEPWVWRFKDIFAFWDNSHFDRPAGVRAAAPTGWVPRSKPIWFTELGCGAVDKGANQPNIFGDAKSAESGRPYFSNGLPDALMQRQFLRAHLAHWASGANPVSEIYAAPMVDLSRMALWTWDARPFPAFPDDRAAWADGVNHATGHWLTGRLGAAASDELAQAVAADFGVDLAAVEARSPLLHGMQIEGPATAREALAGLTGATGLVLAERAGALRLLRPNAVAVFEVAADELAAEDAPLEARRRPDASEAIGRLTLGYTDRERDYQPGNATALARPEAGMAAETSPLVLDGPAARQVAERLLIDRMAAGETLELRLPYAFLALEPGDVLALAGRPGRWVIEEIRDAETRQLSLRALPADLAVTTVSDGAREAYLPAALRAIPVVATVQLPPLPESVAQSRLLVAAWSDPWPGSVSLVDEATGSTVLAIDRRSTLGVLAEALVPGPLALWDRVSVLTLVLNSGHLASAEAVAVLGGVNRVAVETDAGGWEIIGFANAELVATRTYRLTMLLRGLDGSDFAIGTAGAGNRVVVLDGRTPTLPVPASLIGETLMLQAYAGSGDLVGQALTAELAAEPALPLRPGHPRAVRNGVNGAVTLRWTRRSRGDASGWGAAEAPLEQVPEAYLVTIRDGTDAVLRTLSAGTPSAIYSAVEQLADFGGVPMSFAFDVAQVSPVLGPGHRARGEFHA